MYIYIYILCKYILWACPTNKLHYNSMDLNQHFPVRINTNRRYTSCLDKTCHEPQVMNANWYQPIADPQADSTWKIDGSSLRQTLTVVWHSGQFFDLPRLERGGWIWLESLSLPRFGTLRNHFPLVSKLTFFQANRFFQSHVPNCRTNDFAASTSWWNMVKPPRFCLILFFLLMSHAMERIS